MGGGSSARRKVELDLNCKDSAKAATATTKDVILPTQPNTEPPFSASMYREEEPDCLGYSEHLDEISDDGLNYDLLSPRQQEINETNRQSWEMVSQSLGMDGDELLFNMMYFGDDGSGSPMKSLGAAINNAIEETVALHSENNTPYKLRPASIEQLEKLHSASFSYSPDGGVRQYDEESKASAHPRPEAAADTRDCLVCREEFTSGCSLIKLPRCAHVFHSECLEKWLQLQSWCPVCRSELADPAPEPSTPIQTFASGNTTKDQACSHSCLESMNPAVGSVMLDRSGKERLGVDGGCGPPDSERKEDRGD